MKRKMFIFVIFIIAFTFVFLAACSSIPFGMRSTPTPTQMDTPIPTSTPLPTFTPTHTITPQPTDTPTPTSTNTATPTPIGSGGGLIVFQRNFKIRNEETSDFYIMGVDGSNPTNITNNSDVNVYYYSPRWSPDGTQILFSKQEYMYDGNDEWRKSELFTMNSDGSNLNKMSPAPQYKGQVSVVNYLRDGSCDWSPDGKFIVVGSNRHTLLKNLSDYSDEELFIISTSTYETTQLTDAPGKSSHPSWSPDGTKIAFMSDRDGDWDIYIINVDGKGLRQITRNRFSDRFPEWSPDGSEIVFHSDRDGNIELYTITFEELIETRLTTNPAMDQTASWSPDGQWIVFQSDRDGDLDLYIMKLDGTDIYVLTKNSEDDLLADFKP